MVNHAFHMAEIWDHAAKQYKIVEKLLDPESDICGCVTDIENNDILNFLNVLAFQMRYPGITTGNKTITDFCKYRILYSQSFVDSGISQSLQKIGKYKYGMLFCYNSGMGTGNLL